MMMMPAFIARVDNGEALDNLLGVGPFSVCAACILHRQALDEGVLICALERERLSLLFV